MIKMSVAIDQNGMIGSGSELPWNFKDFPEDMKHFRDLTLGQTVIMGRGCFESLGSKPLKERTNIIVTSKPQKFVGYYWAPTLTQAVETAEFLDSRDIILIGGRGIYKEALQHAIPQEVYVTLIENTFVADIEGNLGNLSSNYNMTNIKSFVGEDQDKTPYHIIKYVRKF